MRLPFGPPLAPMLAKLEREISCGEGWRYEPKWDGFRAIVFREASDVRNQSRDSRGSSHPLGLSRTISLRKAPVCR
jgi:ATP-dependent DNA ligase